MPASMFYALEKIDKRVRRWLPFYGRVIYSGQFGPCNRRKRAGAKPTRRSRCGNGRFERSEEHTSELQSRLHLVCRLLLEKKTGLSACVAPNCFAMSSFPSTRSTATISAAPATRAPWITLMPTPPHPKTTTDEPDRTRAVL